VTAREDLDDRPTADEMLARIRAESGTGRGRLRVYLGMAPGVGKTFRMLEEAHRRLERGTDLVIGFVEPHGRPRTIELLDGLEVVPRRSVEYRGVMLDEMDTDAVVARHPEVALVDELAHTNVPGSPREKRWQDVEVIRDAGIDVVSTLNVQHLDSVADAVATITGAPVHERLPDAVLESAEEVELVDMSPRALRQRMRHGNVYPPDRARIALDRFFTEANLTALRELSLRFTAGRVDEQLREIMTGQGIERTWAVTTRLAVIVDHRSQAPAILRRAAEMAATMRGELIAVAVETPADAGHGHDRAQDLRENLEYAEELGAEVVRREAPSLIEGVIEVARQRRVTHIVLQYEPAGRVGALLRPALADQLMARLPDVELLLIGRGAAAPE
jgi:two-component system sensor histidine kinase KdpD